VAILRFRHKGLASFFHFGSTAGIQAKHADRLRLILGFLNVAKSPRDMGLAGWRLHGLKGQRAGCWSVRVSASWRVTFRFDGPDATDVDYEDYH
jgi:proteic killer suppression protein